MSFDLNLSDTLAKITWTNVLNFADLIWRGKNHQVAFLFLHTFSRNLSRVATEYVGVLWVLKSKWRLFRHVQQMYSKCRKIE